MFGTKYRDQKTNKQVQILTKCKILPQGVEGICYQDLYGIFSVNVMEASAFFAQYEMMVKHTGKKIENVVDSSEKMELVEESQQPEEQSEEMSRLLAFLDADTYREKIQLLMDMRDELDDHMLNNMAVSLDLSIEEGMDGYNLIMSELKIRSKYEGKRGERL